MPQSKKRDAHKHPHQDFIPHKKKTGSAKPAAMVFCTLLALAVAWLSVGEVSIWLLIGLVLGIASGYFLGSQMDKSFNKS